MKYQPTDSTALPGWMRSWERFWFTPADPTVLGLIRILCGLITVYTLAVYGFFLDETMGKDAWVDLKLRRQFAHDRPLLAGDLSGTPGPRYVPPSTPAEKEYATQFEKDFGSKPLPPYPRTEFAAKASFKYAERFNVDPRIFGLRLPENEWEEKYLWRYTENWNRPPPDYAANEEEADAIDAYMRQESQIDPRLTYARGSPIWSVWMHVTDPAGMMAIHWVFVFITLLFVLGLGGRVTCALTWAASLCYIHRDQYVLFGADTMMNILLLYLTIGPSTAALSLDRLVARWWRGWGPGAPPTPTVSANVAVRLLQVHVCIIYLMAGMSKLQGGSWWNGSALWGVLANFEFAPMNIGLYNDFLRWLARDQFRFDLVMTAGSYFTLTFEISYVFLVWWPRTRWVILACAILLHGTIGVFMGLKTFSFLMLVMNMAFLRSEEVHWLLRLFHWSGPARPVTAAPALAREAVTGVAVKK
jgi:hypothetical protein